MSSLPSLFLAHGAPDLPVSDHIAGRFLNGLSAQIERPSSILVVSAHWEAATATIGTKNSPDTVYDFAGFSPELYRLKYPTVSDSKLGCRVVELLKNAGFKTNSDPKRGYDHGVWVPLSMVFPEADIPVTQLSLIRRDSPRTHFELGKALAPLREEGVLIIGSGAIVHNLRYLAQEGTSPMPWASDFQDWFKQKINARALNELLDIPNAPTSARFAHPTLEHLMPVFVAMGAGWNGGENELLHESYSYGSISMASYAFGSHEELETLREGRSVA